MIFWIIFIILEIIRNYILIEKKKIRPNYAGSFIWRAFFGLVCYILAHRGYVDPIVNIVNNIPFIIWQLTSFWIFFDIGLNLSRGKPIGYKGKTSGWLDRLPVAYYWLFKVIALIIMVYTIIFI